MKTKLALLVLLAASVVVIFSCSKSDNAVNTNSNNFDSPEWMVQEPNASAAETIGGTLDKPFELVPQDQDIRMMDGDQRGDGMGDRMTDRRTDRLTDLS